MARRITTPKRKPKEIDLSKLSFSCSMDPDELEALRPPQPIDPVEFTKFLRMPLKNNLYADIDLSLTPYLVDPIRDIADYSIETLGCIGPTQSGKTVVLQVATAWTIDQDPGPMLMVYPNERMAKMAISEKLIGMVNETARLSGRIKSVRDISKEGIKFDSMTIYPAWSNSPPTINMAPKKRVVLDEVRLFTLTIGRESNAIKLAEDRLTTYRSQGIAQMNIVSSPSIEGDLLHQQLSVPGTLELFWHVPCPECGKYQRLKFFKNIKKPDEDHTRARCVCVHCGGEFSDKNEKREWNAKGVYAPEGAEIDLSGNVLTEIPKAKRKFYRWDSCVSPFRSFQQIWDEFIKTKDKRHDYRNFFQCWLAEFWKEDAQRNEIEILKARKGTYVAGTVPNGVKVLTAGIDTQDRCLYFTIHGHGATDRWLIAEDRIDCAMSTTSEDELFHLVMDLIADRVFIGETGEQWTPAIVSWDSGGHRTKEVYGAVKRIKNAVAIKGRNGQARRIMYSAAETHYNIRSIEYFEEMMDYSRKENYHVPSDVSEEFFSHFENKVRSVVRHKRTGATKVEFVSVGAEHLFDAGAYSFACLDIQIRGVGMLRARLADPNFKLNPCIGRQRMEKKQEAREADDTDPFARHESRSTYDEYSW